MLLAMKTKENGSYVDKIHTYIQSFIVENVLSHTESHLILTTL